MVHPLLAVLALLDALSGGGATYIRAGQVFDGHALLGSRVIVVRDSLIEAVEESGFAIPVGASVIDATGATVLPGFIDGHIHFMAPPMPYTDSIERRGWGRLAAEGMSSFPANRRHLLMNGVTAIVDMGAPLATYRGLRAALDKGKIIGPELYFPGPLITAPGGHPAGTTYLGQHDLIDNGTFQTTDTAEVRREVAALAGHDVDFVKIVYDRMWYRKGGAPRLKLEVAQAAIDEGHRHGLKVFAHVGSEEEAFDMVRVGADGIEHGFKTTSDSLLSEMAARGVFFTPTICAYLDYAPAAVPSMKQTLRRAWELGVPIVVGTDFPASGGEYCGDDIFKETALWEETGIPRLRVLEAATATAAAKIGRDRAIGSIAPGNRANLVFVRGSVDTGRLDADRIERVMLHGRVVVEHGRVPAAYARGFRENSTMFFGYPYWDPVLSVLLGANATDFDLFRTGIAASADILYSTRNMWSANLVLDVPSPVPKTALRTGAHFDNQNRLFYGIGNDTKLGDTTEYSNLIFREWASGKTRIAGPWKALSSVQLDQTTLTPYGDRSLPDTLPGRSGGDELAVSLALVHDTRDHQVNPWYGHYLGVGAQAAPALFPRGHRFARAFLDARAYASPGHRHILAGRLLYQQAFGDVPFYNLPEFGGDTLGRGYLPYRFRDRVAVIGQFEYRFPIYKFLSGAAYVEAGQFRASPSTITLSGFHPAVGFGPRFSFGSNESSILGIDVGFTPEGWNLVLHNGQVF